MLDFRNVISLGDYNDNIPYPRRYMNEEGRCKNLLRFRKEKLIEREILMDEIEIIEQLILELYSDEEEVNNGLY